MRALRPFLFALAATALACGGQGTREYSRNDLQLLTAYGAKEMCSCLFVMGHTEAYCRNWTRQSPAVNTFRIDTQTKTVESTAAMMWSARARFTGERFGCVLE